MNEKGSGAPAAGSRKPKTERIDLPELHGLYLLLDSEMEMERSHSSFVKEDGVPRRGYGDGVRGARGRCVHVISPHAGGEVRGYFLIAGRLHLRLPSYPLDWPEIDAATAAVLRATEVFASAEPSASPGEQMPLLPDEEAA